MSGHSKWSKIKHKKASEDARKSKEFSKMARVLTVESKKVGGDMGSATLRKAIERAKAINMPAGNIERAIKKGSEKDAAALEEVIYEAYGPGGTAIIIVGLTDNKNRTAPEIKHLLSLHGGNLASQGAAQWAFSKGEDGWAPNTTVTLNDEDGNALSVLIEELEDHDDVQAVYTNAV